MNVNDLKIDEALKLKLSSLLKEFESHRVFTKVIDINKEISSEENSLSIKEKKKTNKNTFFHKFFFSEVV